MAVYQLFGLSLVSDYPFVRKPHTSIDKLDSSQLLNPVYFACNTLPPFPVNWEEGRVIFSQKYHGKDGEAWEQLLHFDDYDVLRFAGCADFFLRADRIDCHLYNSANQELVELYLLGVVLAFWLERQGKLTLHTSAIVINGKIVAFPSHSGNGKSTLAAAFLQAGATLLTDDILPIENLAGAFWGFPGMPQINLWPDQVAHFMNNNSKEFTATLPGIPKKRVPVEAIKDGAFCHETQPLAYIYFPSKYNPSASQSSIKITPVTLAEAVIELIRYSFIAPTIAEKMGWQGHRLDFFARLAKQVPVRRLHYPAGFEYLPRVAETVLRDMENLSLRQDVNPSCPIITSTGAYLKSTM